MNEAVMETMDVVSGEKAVECTLNKSTSGNSLGLPEARVMAEALNVAEAQNLPLILSARGRFFCAGGDVKVYAESENEKEGLQINREIRSILGKLSQASVPTLALVQGDCFGGGVELISAFQRAIAVPSACFGFWQRRIGLSFGWGGGARLTQRLDQSTLIHQALLARSFSAEKAQGMGLIDEVVSAHGGLMSAKETWLSQVERWSQEPVKAILQFSSELEEKSFESLWWNEDHRAALAKVKDRGEGR